LKVGGAPVRSESGGTDPERSAGNFFFGRALHFLALRSTISRFGERFHGGQYSLVRFLFAVLLLTVPPVPSHLYKWGHVPPCPMESAPLIVDHIRLDCRPVAMQSERISGGFG